MTRKSILFHSRAQQDLTDVAAMLRQLADALETRTLALHQGEQAAHIELPAHVRLMLEATAKTKKRGTRHQLTLRLTWREGEQPAGVTISNAQPDEKL